MLLCGIIRELCCSKFNVFHGDMRGWYRNDTAIEIARSMAKTYDIKASAYKVDGCFYLTGPGKCKAHDSLVSDAANVQRAIADVVKEFGKIDVFVANAGEPQYILRFNGEIQS